MKTCTEKTHPLILADVLRFGDMNRCEHCLKFRVRVSFLYLGSSATFEKYFCYTHQMFRRFMLKWPNFLTLQEFVGDLA